MPYTQELSHEDNIINVTYSGDVTIEDIEAVTAQDIAYLNTTDKLFLHIVLDVTQATSTPTSLAQVLRFARQVGIHPKMGWWIICGQNSRMTNFLIQMVARIMRIRFREVTNRQEAYQFLAPYLTHENVT